VVVLVEPHATGGGGGAEVVEVFGRALVSVGRLPVNGAGAVRCAQVRRPEHLGVVEYALDVVQELRVPDVGADALQLVRVEQRTDLRHGDRAVRSLPITRELDLPDARLSQHLEHTSEAATQRLTGEWIDHGHVAS
jgi:hypothetical protein